MTTDTRSPLILPKRFGRLAKVEDARTLRFADYLTPALPTPPPTYNSLDRVFQRLGTTDIGALFPMDGNDTVGDCTIAAVAHLVTIMRGLIGQRDVLGAAACLKLYFQLTGGPQNDTGLAELEVMRYWQKHRVAGDQVRAFVAIDPSRWDHVQLATWLFGGVYIGFQVQQDAIADFDAVPRIPWTSGLLTQDGHAVVVHAANADGSGSVLTWGGVQPFKRSWWNQCVDEAYALIGPEAALVNGYDPGFNATQLFSDLQAIAA